MPTQGAGPHQMAEQSAEAQKAEQSADNPILKFLGPPVMGGALAVLTWFAVDPPGLGPELITFAKVLGSACALVVSLMYGRYVGVLGSGGEAEGSREQKAYAALRQSLVGGGLIGPIYVRWITAFLDGVDHFFGDADTAAGTLFPHAFGLKTPSPSWTAPAFDRCLLLALLYPIATIHIIWAISGIVGPAEAALHLIPNANFPERAGEITAIGFLVLAGRSIYVSNGRTSLLRRFSFAILIFLVLATFLGLSEFSASIKSHVINLTNLAVTALFVAGAVSFATTGVGVLAFALSFIATAGFLFPLVAKVEQRGLFKPLYLMVADHPLVAVALIFVLFAVIMVIPTTLALASAVAAQRFTALFIARQCHGSFILFFLVAMILSCLWLANLGLGTALLLFIVLLTLLNAPFDWISVGLTRALLRRGLELAGWWPLFLALLDAFLAVVVIGFLVLTMVIGVQAFDDLAVRGGGAPVLPLGPFFDGIAAHPAEPEYWWVYATLFSTMIPSIINLVIGGASLMRGVPGVAALLLKFMPANQAVPVFDRAWIATVLTLQLVGGAILGIAVQFGLIYVVFWHVMPRLGLELLDMARAVAAYDLPGKLLAGR
jgi:hypothetical protein